MNISFQSRNKNLMWPLATVATLGALSLASLARDETPQTTTPVPELVLQSGHSGPVNALALSPDGQTLVSAGTDKTLRFWNAQSGELLRVIAKPKVGVQAVAFSPDGQWLASASGTGDSGGDDSGELLLWQARTGQLQRTFLEEKGNLSGTTSSIAFSPDGSTLAVVRQLPAERLGVVDLWDVRTGKRKRTLGAPQSQIYKIAFSPDGHSLAAAGAGSSVRLWDIATARLTRTFKGQGKNQLALAFSPDGKTLAGAGVEAEEMTAVTFLSLWDVTSGKVKRTLPQAGVVGAIGFTPDGKTLMSGGGMMGFGEIRFWDLATGKSNRTLTGRSDALFPLALSSGGQSFATAGFAPVAKPEDVRRLDYFIGDLQLWDADTGKLRRTLRGSHRPVSQVAWTPDGSALLEVGEEQRGLPPAFFGPGSAPRGRGLDIWDARTGKLQTVQSGQFPFALSPDGRTRAFMDEVSQPQKQFYQGADGKPHVQIIQVPKTVLALQDTGTGRRRATVGQRFAPQSLVFSPDGKSLAVANYKGESEATYQSQGVLMLYDAATGRAKWTQPTSTSVSGNGVAFSPDGALIATGGSTSGSTETGAVQLRSSATGKLVRTLKTSGSGLLSSGAITALAFAPNGKTLVGRSIFGVFWWNIASGKQQRALQTTGLISEGDDPGAGGSTPLAVSPDGLTLATETAARTIRLWDFPTGRLKRELVGHSGAVLSLAFSPDSRSLASGSWDGTTKVWDVATGEVRATLLRLPDTQSTGTTSSKTPNWIAFTPDGFYQASPEAEPLIRWRVGNTLYPAADFPTRRRPNLLSPGN